MEGSSDLKELYRELRSRAERILIVVDLAQELTRPGLGKTQRWNGVVEMLTLFVEQKLLMDTEHEIGIALLTQGEPMDASEGYDVSVLVAFIMRLQEEKHLFQTQQPLSIEVDKLFRMIVVYGRSSKVPHFSGMTTEELQRNPTAFCDLVFIHGGGREDGQGVAPESAETTQKVLSWLVEHFESLKVPKTCYCIEASTNSERFVRQFMTLLA